MRTTDYTIETVIPDVKKALATGNLVLQATPGAGKTTIVPLRLLGEDWLGGKKIIMLEPRRLAARSAACRIAELLGEKVGETVGYRVRNESRIGSATRIEIVTEGIFTRMIQNNPELEGVGLVIFDEVHERSLQTDLGLALCLEAQEVLCPDVRILAMSATLDSEKLANLLNDSPVVSCESRMFPVEVQYQSNVTVYNWEQQALSTLCRIVEQEEGSVLVFLPGVASIKRIEAELRKKAGFKNVNICPLYGALSLAEQRNAILPPMDNTRKIVLATSIAETSLTIEGIRIVVDCGWRRRPEFDPESGLTQLKTKRISLAEAEQRKGRAGRLEAGICYRLWSKLENNGLQLQSKPEILDADLTDLALELAQWGCRNPDDLKWLDSPAKPAFTEARKLLQGLDALDEEGTLTSHGQQLLNFGIHPRLAHMLIKAEGIGLAQLGCDIASLIEERDIFLDHSNQRSCDLRERLEVLQGATSRYKVDQKRISRIKAQSKQLYKRVQIKNKQRYDIDKTGLLLAFAYPDRIAKKRSGDETRYLLSNGRGATFLSQNIITKEEFVTVASLDKGERDAVVYLAAPLQRKDLTDYFSSHFEEQEMLVWDDVDYKVIVLKRNVFGAIVLVETQTSPPKNEKNVATLLNGIKNSGIDKLPWTGELRNLQARLAFLRIHDPAGDWPDISDEMLEQNLDLIFGPFLTGITRLSQITSTIMTNALRCQLSMEQVTKLDLLAPERLTVPTGSRLKVDYNSGETPVLAVKIQEMYGLADTPKLLNGKVPILLHLLSPAGRPAQITSDLKSFWEQSYFLVRKDLKGRYPKHFWPDDPANAAATRKTKKNMDNVKKIQ